MRHLEPARDIRTEFQYNNLAYNAASIVTERISGQSYEEFIRARLTDKLQMKVSFSTEELAAASDAAVPYLVDARRAPAHQVLANPHHGRRRHQHLGCRASPTG